MEFTLEVQRTTDPIYQKISKFLPEIEWSIHAPYIYKINKLKKEKNAIILAHNYQTPEIYHGIADVAADSLALAIEASKTDADLIINQIKRDKKRTGSKNTFILLNEIGNSYITDGVTDNIINSAIEIL